MLSLRSGGAIDLQLLTTGVNAHGYGQLADNREFAFRVRNGKARLEVYRAGADPVQPQPADIELVAHTHTGQMNLDSRRSLTALLRVLLPEAATEHERPERTLRAYFVRLDALLDDWTDQAQDSTHTARPGRSLRSRLFGLFSDAA